MNKSTSYENVIKELAESFELEYNDPIETEDVCDSEGRTFKFEYAHEYLTERHSAYKRRISNV